MTQPSRLEDAARQLCEHLAGRRDEILGDIATLVELESPSSDIEALGRAADWLAKWLEPAGAVSVITTPDGRRLLLLKPPGADERGPLLLCHYDTVWPVGTLAEWPFEIKDGIATGPGIYDMKASSVCGRHILLALQELGLPCGARLLLTPDEEIGSKASHATITEISAKSSAVLVLEPPLDDGRLKTTRKGHGYARISVTGRSAHAGVAPEEGINAIDEIAQIVRQLRGIAGSVSGGTVSVGRINGGRALNMVPEHAEIGVDIRAWTAEGMGTITTAINALCTEHPDARIEIVCTVDHGPVERKPSTAALVERCKQASAAVGLTVSEGGTGGGSDGSIAQAAGAPVLDGFGVRGAGPHARHERIYLEPLIPHMAVIGAMVADLTENPDV
jgi:glutamate carboxypeptidase